MPTIKSFLKIGLTLAALLPALYVVMMAGMLIIYSGSISNFLQGLGDLVPAYLPLGVGIGVAWLVMRWRGRWAGWGAGIFSLVLGYAIYGFISVREMAQECSKGISAKAPCMDFGYVYVIPIFLGVIHALALTGILYLLPPKRQVYAEGQEELKQ